MQLPGCVECDGTGTIADIDVMWAPCEDDQCLCGGHYVPDITYYACPACVTQGDAAPHDRRAAC